MDEERASFFRCKLIWISVGLLLVIIVGVIAIFLKQVDIIFPGYTTMHSLTRYYTEEDYRSSTELIEAIRAQERTEITRLLATNMEVNCPDQLKEDALNDIYPVFPIEVACEVSDYETVKALFKKGAVIRDDLLSLTLK